MLRLGACLEIFEALDLHQRCWKRRGQVVLGKTYSVEARKCAESIGDSILQIILVEVELFELGEKTDGLGDFPCEEVAPKIYVR